MTSAELVEARLELLKDHPFCAGFTHEQLAALLECSTVRHYAANEYVWRQGETSDQLMLICAGEISLEISLPLHGPCRIEAITAGEVLDSSWLTPTARWPFDARAASRVTAVVLKGKLLREACATDQRLGYELLRRFSAILSMRLQNNRRRVLDGLQSTRNGSR